VPQIYIAISYMGPGFLWVRKFHAYRGAALNISNLYEEVHFAHTYGNITSYKCYSENRPYKKRIHCSNFWTRLQPGLTAEI
jgi:hypothetical protein